MAASIVHVEWLNENRNRRYPFWDSAAMTDQSASMEVPNELIVDLVFPISSLAAPTSFYLKQLVVFGGGVTIELGYQGSTVATRTITAAEHTENKSYLIEGEDSFSDSVGRITIGKLDAIKQYGGIYTFDSTSTPLLPTVFNFSVRGVNALRVVSSDNEVSELLQGDIELVAGDNIGLVVSDLGGGVKQLKVSAVASADYQEECECPDSAQGEPILSINGYGPDESGNLDILGLGCVAIQTSTGEMQITDTCAEPCCGCAELEVLRNELSRLGSQIATQRALAQRALANIEQLRDVIVVSRLGSVTPC